MSAREMLANMLKGFGIEILRTMPETSKSKTYPAAGGGTKKGSAPLITYPGFTNYDQKTGDHKKDGGLLTKMKKAMDKLVERCGG